MWIKNFFMYGGEVPVGLCVFILGGVAYGIMETLFRGYTHWTMVITGGACVLTLYLLSGWILSLPLGIGALAGAAIITAYEFCVGMIVNVRLGWEVWDYSGLLGNLAGQICPQFTAIWFGCCLAFFAGVKMLMAVL